MSAISGTLGEWASRNSRAILVVEQYGLDWQRDAGVPLAEACAGRGADAAAVAAEIDAVTAPRTAASGDWDAIPLPELTRHIYNRHHEYLKLELPRLQQQLDRLAAGDGERDGRLLARLHEVYSPLHAELDGHLQKEEYVLFPLIESMARAEAQGLPCGPSHCGSVRNPIFVMEAEHSSAQEALAQMREITRGYVPSDAACAGVRAIFHSLEELEADLHEHIRLENDFLHPRAAALEQRLLAA